MTTTAEVRRTATFGGAQLAAHDHVCAFVLGEEERERLALSFFTEGLEDGEACRYVGNRRDGRRMAATMAGKGVDLRLFEVSQPCATPMAGPLDVDSLIGAAYSWSRAIAGQDRRRFTRTLADMTALHTLAGSAGFQDRLAAYEVRVSAYTTTAPHVFVCMFDFGVFGGDVLMASLKAHRDAWMGGQVLARLPLAQGARPV
ncbi:MEDS domain-containing protein [Pseudonocardia bannensis]|uniref:MEDS domain-containing protein n=1 Tax=Pseudonocardia bannensis TaxID=630973 RepID=A0A848DGK8_9PSEU|nr:MEDS domain-containing protein [Pseudonocardia bannensis]NMH91679.1 hypothetical protein [Pseudonocardia bannensis]